MPRFGTASVCLVQRLHGRDFVHAARHVVLQCLVGGGVTYVALTGYTVGGVGCWSGGAGGARWQ